MAKEQQWAILKYGSEYDPQDVPEPDRAGSPREWLELEVVGVIGLISAPNADEAWLEAVMLFEEVTQSVIKGRSSPDNSEAGEYHVVPFGLPLPVRTEDGAL